MSHHHCRSRPESAIRRHGARIEAVIRERRLNRQRARQHTENLQRLEEQRINSVDSEEEVITSHHFDHSFMNDRLENNDDRNASFEEVPQQPTSTPQTSYNRRPSDLGSHSEMSEKKMTLRRKQDKIGRWYFGGLASAGAACCTHPLDLLKVHLQTQQAGKMGLGQMAVKLYKSDGVLAFYNGISASLLRQLTYSTTRFGLYETLKKQFPQDQPLPFYQKAFLAGFSGACGGFVGTPGDLVNVRMQNDMKLPPAQRRNYKHALDGIFRILREEGLVRLFGGASMATSRAVLMTIGQLSFYDQIKQMMIEYGIGKDNLYTHFSSSFCAASIATVLTQPLDVMKTRLMNAPPGQFKGIVDCFFYTAKLGPAGFFKGFIPAWVRLAPHTVLTFIFFEQLRFNFGYYK